MSDKSSAAPFVLPLSADQWGIVRDGAGAQAAAVTGSGTEREQRVALIVRAVNCHADLLSALAPFARIADEVGPKLSDEIGIWTRTDTMNGDFTVTLGDCRRARAAIAKARA